jgi:hypothetical protein
LLLSGLNPIHIVIFPICIGLITVGILQTPKEF